MCDFFHRFNVFLFCKEFRSFCNTLPGIFVHCGFVEKHDVTSPAAFSASMPQIRFFTQIASAMTMQLVAIRASHNDPPECFSGKKRQHRGLGIFHYTICRGKKSLNYHKNYLL